MECIEGRTLGGFMCIVVVGKFCEQEEVGPVVLLVVDVGVEVLFQCLIRAFRLFIGLRVVARGEVESHVKDGS